MAENEEEKITKLAHFQEVTGLSDLEQCRSLLERHHWNLEMAVQDTLNFQEGVQPVFDTPHVPRLPEQVPQSEPVRPRPHPHMVSMVTHQQQQAQPQGWWEWLVNWAFFPIRLVISTFNELTQLILNVLVGNRLPAPAHNARGDVMEFISQFEQTYGMTHPPFLECSYGEALEHAKRDLKFLLVYLHSSGHQDTPDFCREVLATDVFTDVLISCGCLIWAVDVNSEEGTRVSFILRESTYPFMSVIMLRGSRMTVIGRLEGYITLSDVIDKLQQMFSANEPELVVLRTERQQRSLDQQIRQEQEEEYLKSLQADQEKTKRREQEIQRAAEAAEKERQKELAERERLEAFQREKEIRRNRLPAEPSSNDTSAIHINIRLPDGSRLERLFSPSDKLESLYDLAYTYDDIPYNFTLLTNYPRRELHCDERGGPLLSDMKLGRKCLLFIRDNTE